MSFLRPLISIVVLSYSDKRRADLEDFLKSVDEQDYRNLEVIAVVERSEPLARFVREYNLRFAKSCYFTQDKLGVSKARNVGVGMTSGKFVAFVDDDAVLARDWATRLVESFENHSDVIGVTGRTLPLARNVDLNSFPASLFWAIGCTRPGDSRQHYTNFASGTNMAFRREAFESHRFALDIIEDSRGRSFVYSGLPNDENDFAIRLTTDLGRPILYEPRLVVLHKVYPERITLKFIKQYAFWQGFAEARYLSNPKWRTARGPLYSKFLRLLARDFTRTKGGMRAFFKRLAFLLTGLLFVTIGSLAFRSESVLRFGRSML